MSLSKNIFKVGTWTAISRVLGFVRDMMIGRVLGVGRLSDIFLAAFKLPNLFRDLLGEGALSSVFIPMFAEHKSDAPNAARFANNTFAWLMAVLLGITIIAEILMPFIMLAFAPGFDAEKLVITTYLSRIMFFYVIFICGAALLSAILNAFSEFAFVAAMPVLMNIFMILGLFIAAHANMHALYIMAVAVLISGLVQFWVLWKRIKRHNFGLKIVKPKLTPQIKTMFKRMSASLIASGFYQVNILIAMVIASYESGAVSWLYYSDRMVQLPFGIIGLAAGTVLLTSISDALAKKNMRSIYIQQNSSIRQSLMLTLPCMVGLIVLAEPIIRLLFEYGKWTHDATIGIAAAMMIQALALPAMVTSQIFTKTLYAAQNVKTPVKISIVAMGVGIILMLSLMNFIGYLAMPVATVVSGYLRNLWLAHECKIRGLYQLQRKTKISVGGFIILSVLMGAVLWFAKPFMTNLFIFGGVLGIAGLLYLMPAWIINKKS